jgi:hypothetical protein
LILAEKAGFEPAEGSTSPSESGFACFPKRKAKQSVPVSIAGAAQCASPASIVKAFAQGGSGRSFYVDGHAGLAGAFGNEFGKLPIGTL